MTKILFIGATGHIGGALLELVITTFPTIEIIALVRDQQKAHRLRAQYSTVKTIIGDLRDTGIIRNAAAEVDIVINTGPDKSHARGIEALLQGLAKKKTKGYYLHTSGAALIWDEPDGSFAGERVWDDITDIDTITSMPDHISHRQEDKLVFEAHSFVNVAIISPVMVYGLGPSVDHPFPLVLPEYLKVIRSLGSGFTISKGANVMGYVHVRDCASLYLTLVSYALQSVSEVEGNALWGPKAYYFASSQELPFHQMMSAMVKALKRLGALADDTIKIIDTPGATTASGATAEDDPQSWARHIAASCGVNMRVRSSRATRIGWVPKEAGFEDTIEEVSRRFIDRETGA